MLSLLRLHVTQIAAQSLRRLTRFKQGEGGVPRPPRPKLLNPFRKPIFMHIALRSSPAVAAMAPTLRRSRIQKKEGVGTRLVIVVGGSKLICYQHFLLGREQESGTMCAVHLTRRGVIATQFSTGQEIHCTPGREADFAYDGLAPRHPPSTHIASRAPAYA